MQPAGRGTTFTTVGELGAAFCPPLREPAAALRPRERGAVKVGSAPIRELNAAALGN